MLAGGSESDQLVATLNGARDKDNTGNTLFHACHFPEALSALLKRGFDLNATNKVQRPALPMGSYRAHHALWRRHLPADARSSARALTPPTHYSNPPSSPLPPLL